MKKLFDNIYFKKIYLKIFYIIIPVMFLTSIAYFYLSSLHKIYTENAYIKTDMISVSAEITGRIDKVFVKENQDVKKGNILFQIDPEPFQFAVNRLEAQLRQIKNTIETQKAIYQQKKVNILFNEKEVAFYQNELNRQLDLFKKKVASASQKDQAQHNFDQAQQKLQASEFDLQSTLAYLNGDQNIKFENHPQYLEATAELDKAKLDLRRTTIYAAEDGIVTRICLVSGDEVMAGSPIFTLFMPQNLWIEANFKETELTNVKANQKARIWVDTYPDQEWTGYVESMGAAAGSEFSVLPPQNATGNWVKVVQRIPVRLRIHHLEKEPLLRAGMSVSVEVDTSSPSAPAAP